VSIPSCVCHAADAGGGENVEAVRALALVCSDDVIAGLLNRNGLRTGHGNRWTRERVTSIRSHYEIPVHRSETAKAEGWMNLRQAAASLGISLKTCASLQNSAKPRPYCKPSALVGQNELIA
jgi:hypothetical protein